jgi:indolepyruvate ferredoxin oxidoreductase beta subunit
MKVLPKDPLNILVAGVGGQGNVMLAQIMGQALVKEGFFAVVGDTFGASQRGGSVASHIRISMDTEYSSIVPKGQADFILGMEPSETLRVMGDYANPNTRVVLNPRVVLPPTVISGADKYPDPGEIMATIKKYSARFWIVNATEEAMKLGNRLYANTILMGATLGTGVLPIGRDTVVEMYEERFTDRALCDTNIKALDVGISLTQES